MNYQSPVEWPLIFFLLVSDYFATDGYSTEDGSTGNVGSKGKT